MLTAHRVACSAGIVAESMRTPTGIRPAGDATQVAAAGALTAGGAAGAVGGAVTAPGVAGTAACWVVLTSVPPGWKNPWKLP